MRRSIRNKVQRRIAFAEMAVCNATNEEAHNEKDRRRPTITCPSWEVRQPWPFWYHGAVKTKMRSGAKFIALLRRTFFARFLRSFRSLRFVFTGAVSRPDFFQSEISLRMSRKKPDYAPESTGTWVQTSSAMPRHRK